jgi:hypothetical protein
MDKILKLITCFFEIFSIIFMIMKDLVFYFCPILSKIIGMIFRFSFSFTSPIFQLLLNLFFKIGNLIVFLIYWFLNILLSIFVNIFQFCCGLVIDFYYFFFTFSFMSLIFKITIFVLVLSELVKLFKMKL